MAREKAAVDAVEGEVMDMPAPELVAMAGEMAALDGDTFGPAPDAAGPAPVEADQAREMRDVLGLVVTMLSPALPYLPGVYTDEKIGLLSAAYVPVAAKYGWDVGGLLGEWGAEIALVAVAAPLAMQTARAHQDWTAERRMLALRAEAEGRAHFAATRNLAPVEPGDRGEGTLAGGDPAPGVANG